MSFSPCHRAGGPVVDLSTFLKRGRQLVRNCEIMAAQISVLNKERVIIIVIIIILLGPAETHLEFYSF